MVGAGYAPHDDTQPNRRAVHLAGFFGLAIASREKGAATTVYDCLVLFVVGAVSDAAVCVARD